MTRKCRSRARAGGPANRTGVLPGVPALEAGACVVLTHSGGMGEETTYLSVRGFTLRDSTERPVTARARTNALLCLKPERLAAIIPARAFLMLAPLRVTRELAPSRMQRTTSVKSPGA